MNKTAIKNFAVWARRKLISEITYKAGLIGISEKGILYPLSTSTDNIQFFDIGTGKPTEIVDNEIKQREALIKRIKEKEYSTDYKAAFQFVVEEVAYTWFNRLIAIRFMEVNDYLPSGIRVLSSETPGKAEPDMVTKPFDTDMEFSSYETDRILQLKDENKLDELFRMLFIKQCNKLNEVLPALFEKTADYTELLLPISFTDPDGIVSHLINDIEEEDFKEAVEIIGWLYQYYNTEPKDEVFALLKKNVKITKERIPAATQLFTPNWIVRYMVENSLGRLWVEGHQNEELKSEWRYYLEEAEQEDSVKAELEKIRAEYKKLSPEDIKVIDPCMGSGHILVYAFDVLMQIYESQGYTQRDAAVAIIENNLYGLDIDDRAYQLAYFAIMMKARKYDRRFLTRGISPKVYAIQESNDINKGNLQFFGQSLNELERNSAIQQLEYLIDTFEDAKEYGSILNVDNCDWKFLNIFVDDFRLEGQLSLEVLDAENSQQLLKKLIAMGEALAQKYDVVITNPPYMGGSGMSAKLSDYLKEFYPLTKSDLFAVFIEKGNKMANRNGYNCMVTMQSWMFLSSYEKMRKAILATKTISNLMHMENMVMGIAFGTAVTNFRNSNFEKYKGTYNHITLKDIGDNGIPVEFPVKANRYAQVSSENFTKIPSSPIVYWLSNKALSAFDAKLLSDYAETKTGMQTCDNARFLRLWHEIQLSKSCLHSANQNTTIENDIKWIPYNKGGDFKKWYGNQDYVLNWANDGEEAKKYAVSLYKTVTRTIKNIPYFYRETISWSKISSGNIAFRYYPNGFIFDVAGCCIYSKDMSQMSLLGLVNSKVAKHYLSALSPTINYEAGHVNSVPIHARVVSNNTVENYVVQNIEISKNDWNCFENSWDFSTHPLITFNNGTSSADGLIEQLKYRIEDAYQSWESHAEAQFYALKANEEELNRIFIEIYGLQDELTPEVEDKDVTVRKADLQRDVKSFVSYAVGCMFGRYSLDVPGLAYAGDEWDTSKYSSFIPDADNCIPITDEEYFEDDIVGRFVAFVKTVYGEDTLEENLDFIAQALGNKGSTSREIIRNYFIKDFYKDHVKMYQKRPIYWLYDSGKQNGFKALVYMHRYTADTTGVLRVDYLHKMQKIYMSEIDRMTDMAENSNNGREVAQAEKRKEKLIKQLKETKEYDEKVAHLALSRIAIDLDDGVKVNYEKVQTGQDSKKLAILGKI
ncbi:BREX-1 system adenine-specific DNA-methyltransferase PglX [Lysinibacillus sp. FSL P2-0066]|uniref:BREX-1 system adenine-specific DNA-methyltransferase PglX n=1 Tax=Lysinibacillus sp. FSL P2-0066 TaxID=2921720 RepID=UPI0030DBF9E5